MTTWDSIGSDQATNPKLLYLMMSESDTRINYFSPGSLTQPLSHSSFLKKLSMLQFTWRGQGVIIAELPFDLSAVHPKFLQIIQI